MVGSSPPSSFSAYFGSLNLEQAAILTFPQGLPGFEGERQFAAIQIPEHRPLVYLQSLLSENLCLMTLPVHAIDPAYQVDLAPEDRTTLQITASSRTELLDDALVLAIVAVDPERGPTVNMAAPLVINLANHLVVQAPQPDVALSHCHALDLALAQC